MIFSWLNNLKIRNKLMLLLAVPISVLLLFSIMGVIEKWHRFKDAWIQV